MAVNIVTGMTGTPHITSDDDRIRNAAYFGRHKIVLDVGQHLSAEKINNNLVRINDGMCINQGTQMGIEPSDYETLGINSGLAGVNRNDLIVMRYAKDQNTGLESASLEVIQGVAGDTAVDPEYIEGNILDGGDFVDDMPLYRVKIRGLVIDGIDTLYTLWDVDTVNYLEMQNKMDKTNPTGTGALSINRKSGTTIGNKSVAVGNNSEASMLDSVAIGADTKASEQRAVAMGYKATASGEQSVAIGSNVTASGNGSTAMGEGTLANKNNLMAVGKYNSPETGDLFEVGNGTGSSAKSNAFRVKSSGDIVASGDVYDGYGNKLSDAGSDNMSATNPTGTGALSINRASNSVAGGNSVAIGAETRATDQNAVAIGYQAKAYNENAVAIGSGAEADVNDTYAFGEGTLANANCKNALGKFNNPTAGDLLEVGNGTSNSRSNAVRITNAGNIIAGGDIIDGDGNKLSDALTGEITTSQDNIPYLYKPNTHSAVYDTLIGGTVAYNQLVENGNFASTSGWTLPSPMQLTVSGNEAILTNLGKKTLILRVGALENKTQTGHVIIFVASYKKVGSVTGDFTIGAYTSNYTWATYKQESLDSSWKTIVLVDKPVLEVSTFACGGDSMLNIDSGSELHIKNAMCIDLTLMFGSEIADFVYTLEQSESGTGLAFLQQYGFLTEDYYPYETGELLNVKPSAKKVVGFNQWDEEWENGSFDAITGEKESDSYKIRCKNSIKVMPNTEYGIKPASGTNGLNVFFYSEHAYLGYAEPTSVFTTPQNCKYINFSTFGNTVTTYNHDICINISDPTKNGTYEPYHEVVYPLPNTELRGLIKLHNDTDGTWLYADGDVCESVGETERKYTLRALNGSESWVDGTDLGSVFRARLYTGISSNKCISNYLVYKNDYAADIEHFYFYNGYLYVFLTVDNITDFKAFLSNHPLSIVYELATPTTEYTAPFASPQALFKGGTEEFVDNRSVQMPVGHESEYVDLPEWLDNRYVDDLREQASLVPALQNKISDLSKRTSPVYGFHISDSESDPSRKVTYLADAVGMTPAHMDYANDVFDYGSWADVWFVKNCKPCILNADGTVSAYLDKNNFGKDIDGNWITIIPDIGTVQNVMIQFPKIWYKVVPDANDEHSGSVYISPVKVDDDFKDYAYIDYQGNHKEHFYMPAYNGSMVSGKMRSLSGEQVSKSLTGQQEIDACTANGNGWYTEDAGEIMLINFLLILMGKSTDTQAVYGQGLNTGGTEVINDGFTTGVHNTKGMFYGTNDGTIASGDYSNANKIFGMENYTGFQWRRYAGDMLVNGVRKVKLCYGNEDGSTSFGFNSTGNGYVNVGATPSGTNGGYISKMKFGHDGMYSEVSSGSSSTHYCDGQWYNNSYSTIYALRGGSSDNGLLVGALCVYLDNAFGGAGWNVGTAPSYK